MVGLFVSRAARAANPDLPWLLRFGPRVGWATRERLIRRAVRIDSGKFDFFIRCRARQSPAGIARAVFLATALACGIISCWLYFATPPARPEGGNQFEQLKALLSPLLRHLGLWGGLIVPALLLGVDRLLPRRSHILAARLRPAGAQYFYADGRNLEEAWEQDSARLPAERFRPAKWIEWLRPRPGSAFFVCGGVELWLREKRGERTRASRSQESAVLRFFFSSYVVFVVLMSAAVVTARLIRATESNSSILISGLAGIGLMLTLPIFLLMVSLGTHRWRLRLQQFVMGSESARLSR